MEFNAEASQDWSPLNSATLEEAVAFLVDSGFSSSELGTPTSSSEISLTKLTNDALTSNGTPTSVRSEEHPFDPNGNFEIGLVSSSRKQTEKKSVSV
ncbi:hypothetical protein P3T76_010495 [Phytophthora citrophthora]|uniref:Uncharacterized protein n=1 Tax=Phytophthora citrophthora TaxID=4793 RepID=A0AAD9GC41_9STRA|nr:hypothetical protein P3T76_010495 [Phytophthora citrophthora]